MRKLIPDEVGREATMLKLIKYEFRKQLFSKFIMIGVMGVIEVYFLYGIFKNDEKTIGLAALFLVLGAVSMLTFVAFESISTYSKDLRTKQSYMLFMIPKSTYTVIGAKIITALLQIAVVSAAFLILAAVDVTIAMARFGELKQLVDLIGEFFRTLMSIDIRVELFIFTAIVGILQWYLIIVTAMLSITLSSTVLSNNKFKGIASFTIFVAITYFGNKLLGLIRPDFLDWNLSYLIYSSLFLLVMVVGAYFATAWMLDKKVSV